MHRSSRRTSARTFVAAVVVVAALLVPATALASQPARVALRSRTATTTHVSGIPGRTGPLLPGNAVTSRLTSETTSQVAHSVSAFGESSLGGLLVDPSSGQVFMGLGTSILVMSASGQLVSTINEPNDVSALALDGSTLFAALFTTTAGPAEPNELVEVSTLTLQNTSTLLDPAPFSTSSMVFAGGYLWVDDNLGGTGPPAPIIRVDPSSGAVTDYPTIDVGIHLLAATGDPDDLFSTFDVSGLADQIERITISAGTPSISAVQTSLPNFGLGTTQIFAGAAVTSDDSEVVALDSNGLDVLSAATLQRTGQTSTVPGGQIQGVAVTSSTGLMAGLGANPPQSAYLYSSPGSASPLGSLSFAASPQNTLFGVAATPTGWIYVVTDDFLLQQNEYSIEFTADHVGLSAVPGDVDFGSQRVGDYGDATAVTLTNVDVVPVTIDQLGFGGADPNDFFATSDCPDSLGPGASCEVDVTFAPVSLGNRSSSIDALVNGSSAPLVLTTVEGTGTEGYYIAHADGTVDPYGDALFFGDMSDTPLNAPIVSIATTPSGDGYWLLGRDGGIFSFGDAGFYGSTGGMHLNEPVVGMAGTPDGQGYWLVASDGGIFAYGDAGFYGSTGAMHLNEPVVGMTPTPDGLGYWLVASDGGIFAYGDAGFYGSTGGMHLNQPIVGMASTPDGLGYWLVASDGGIFAYGDAGFYGSTGSLHLDQPIVAMAATPDGAGYWFVAADGGLFSFGDAPFYGSSAGYGGPDDVVGLAGTASEPDPS